MQTTYTDLVNRNIQLLAGRHDLLLQLVKNDKKDSDMRKLEKSVRPSGLSSAFCQNAFDCAITHLSNWLNDIRLDMNQENSTIFTRSKVLFAMMLMNASQSDMIAQMNTIAKETKKDKTFYESLGQQLLAMSEQAFKQEQCQFHDSYMMSSLQFSVPFSKQELVPLDSRLHRLEESTNTCCSHVITITNPFKKSDRFSVPVKTSRNGLRRLAQYNKAGTVHIGVNKNGKLRVQVSFDKKMQKTCITSKVGVDTGITDAFNCSNGQAVGSMSPVLDFYKKVVEPSFAGLSDLRNKKASLLHYIRHHNLPDQVKKQLLAKVDRLETMMRNMDAPYRKNRHYQQMLNHEIASDVQKYISSIDQSTLTVLERLDIKEFKSCKKLNGRRSVFARGKLQKRLMEELNWHGYDFMEVEPDYSSQTCPVCGHIDKESRNGKYFHCTHCGHEDDADHNASVVLAMRADDKEFLNICAANPFHQSRQQAILDLGKKRSQEWTTKNPA